MSGTAFTDPGSVGQPIYILMRVLKVLGMDPHSYVPDPLRHAGFSRATDWERMLADVMAAIQKLRDDAAEAKAERDSVIGERNRMAGQLDEAQGEVRAMLEGRRDEEERARMRLLESVLAAAIHPKGMQATVLLPRFADLMLGGASEAGFKRALLEDLDALVALGLRGEVVP